MEGKERLTKPLGVKGGKPYVVLKDESLPWLEANQQALQKLAAYEDMAERLTREDTFGRIAQSLRALADAIEKAMGSSTSTKMMRCGADAIELLLEPWRI